MTKRKIPPYRWQYHVFTCGPAVLQMVLGAFGLHIKVKTLIRKSRTSKRTGTRRDGLVSTLRGYGLRTHAHSGGTLEEIQDLIQRGWVVVVNYREPEHDDGHYAVLSRVTKDQVHLLDPWHGPDFWMSRRAFQSRWYGYHRTRATRWFLAASRRPSVSALCNRLH